jgi:hypothetical protein
VPKSPEQPETTQRNELPRQESEKTEGNPKTPKETLLQRLQREGNEEWERKGHGPYRGVVYTAVEELTEEAGMERFLGEYVESLRSSNVPGRTQSWEELARQHFVRPLEFGGFEKGLVAKWREIIDRVLPHERNRRRP